MLDRVPALSEYDSGNGVCRYLKNNLCEIYDERPMICNVEEMYHLVFKDTMTESEFIAENLKVCCGLAKTLGGKYG
jgi:Fe-S-cluster containining protein